MTPSATSPSLRLESVRVARQAAADVDHCTVGLQEIGLLGARGDRRADGLVRVGVQSAVQRLETAALLRKMMTERGLPVPPANRVIESICVVELCQERTPKKQ